MFTAADLDGSRDAVSFRPGEGDKIDIRGLTYTMQTEADLQYTVAVTDPVTGAKGSFDIYVDGSIGASPWFIT